MFLLDTNVISELSKPKPDHRVVAWLNKNENDGFWTSAITVAELRTGLASLPDGKQKRELTKLIDELLQRFGRSPVSFDGLAAEEYAKLFVARRSMGRPIDVFDAQIAAIAVSHGLTIATRNARDFEGIDGLKLVDPWS